MKRPLIIGFGNPLREDDGVGWRAAEVVEGRVEPGTVDVIRCHQLTPELVYQAVNASFVLFLDAAQSLPPGQAGCAVVRPEESGAWTHHLSPGQLCGLAREVTGEAPAAYLITGGIHRMGWNECLTRRGARAVELMAERAVELLRQERSLLTLSPVETPPI